MPKYLLYAEDGDNLGETRVAGPIAAGGATPAAPAPVTLAQLERDAQELSTVLKYAGVAPEEARIAIYCAEKALRDLNIAARRAFPGTA
jgi:hypothetical protein